MKKDAIKVTFGHQVTKAELIASLEQILNFHGCANCGLNGWDGIFLLGDPDPGFSKLRTDLFTERFKTVINVEHIQAPVSQNISQAARLNQF